MVRFLNASFIGVVLLGCGAFTSPAATFSIANGDVAGLISAINSANSNGQSNTINLAINGTYVLTAVNNSTYDPSGLPVIVTGGISGSLIINARGSTITRSTAGGTPDFRLITVRSSNSTLVIISTAHLTNGRASAGGAAGGAIYLSGSATLNNCTITDNYSSGPGGGIFILDDGAGGASGVALNGCTIARNTAGVLHYGGGIYNAGVNLSLMNCTFVFNRGGNGRDGLANIGLNGDAISTISNCTFYGDDIFNRVVNYQAKVTLGSTILALSYLDKEPNNGARNIIASNGYNLSTSSGGYLTAVGDQTNTDPKLDRYLLRLNGGPTQTIALTYGSPAIDKGNSFGAATDQRGLARIVDNSSTPNAADGADVGAFEAPVDAIQYGSPSFVVTNLNDHDDGACTAADCTLREAINYLNVGLSGVITFATTGTLDLSGGELFLLQPISISGPGARSLAISANVQSRVFSVLNGASSLSGLTVRDGFVGGAGGSSNVGGGIYIETALTMSDCAIVHNRVLGGTATFGSGTDGGMARGGGIFNGGTLTLNRCTIGGTDSNTANGAFGGDGASHVDDGTLYTGGKGGAGLGGGIYNDSNATLTINNCTIAGNTASGGAGAANFGGGAGGMAVAGIENLNSMTVTASTISANSGFGGTGGRGQFAFNNGAPGRGVGGIRAEAGTSTMRNSLIAANTRNQTGGPDVDGTFTSSGFNLIGISNGSTGFSSVSDQTGTTAAPINPQLGPLENNGGPTDTMALRNFSPALDQGYWFNVTSDQRNQVRPNNYASIPDATGGDGSDIGAVEYSGTPPFTLASAVSRKIHGDAGTFDLPLPPSGTLGVESRTGGPTGDHTMIITFSNPLTSVGGAAVTSGVGMVNSRGIGSDPRQYVVNLTGVLNAQRITVTLTNVTDSLGNSSSVVAVGMGVLLGDTNNDGFVNSGDTVQTRSRSGQPADAANFRSDYNLDGIINSGDAIMVRSRSGTSIP